MSQKNNILHHLKTQGGLTPLEALKLYGCMRLAAVINVLKDEGHNIDSEMTEYNGKRFATYSIGNLDPFVIPSRERRVSVANDMFSNGGNHHE